MLGGRDGCFLEGATLSRDKKAIRKRAQALYDHFRRAPSRYKVRHKLSKIRIEKAPVVEGNHGAPEKVDGWCFATDTDLEICVKENADDALIAHELAHLYTDMLETAVERHVRKPTKANYEQVVRWRELVADLVGHLCSRNV